MLAPPGMPPVVYSSDPSRVKQAFSPPMPSADAPSANQQAAKKQAKSGGAGGDFASIIGAILGGVVSGGNPAGIMAGLQTGQSIGAGDFPSKTAPAFIQHLMGSKGL